MNLKLLGDLSYYTFNELMVPNYFFGKPLNFNSNFDDTILEKNKIIVEEIISNKISTVYQKHTDVIKKVTLENYLEKDVADGMITNAKGIALATKIADCQAIFLYDSKKKVIGNVHSGWRGTVNKIVGNAIKIMKSDYGCEVDNIQAFICPSIGQCHFEVDKDVYILFKESFKELDIDQHIIIKPDVNKYYIDTFKINKDYLISIGLNEYNIYLSNMCTVCNENKFHSYRYEKEKSGRNLAVICL